MKGLTSTEVEALSLQYGQNTITAAAKKNILQVFFSQFQDFLTVLLVIAAVASFFIGEVVDGSLIIAIVVLNAVFGIYQEAKAEESLAVLKKMTVTKIRVIRDGQEQEVDSAMLVPGDVCFIEEGVKIPADGTILESLNLEINESVLTGESLPVAKKTGEEIASGTIVARGRGYFRVTGTGMRTKFGQIASHLAAVTEGETPLQKKLAGLTRLIGLMGIAAAVFVFIASLLNGSGYFPAFLLAISLAVAVVPEGLPAVMTITLSVGVKEMARRKSVIRKLSSIEALGSVTLIATDKTGTLTTNRMQVAELYLDGKLYTKDSWPRLDNHPFSLLVTDGILCSTASLVLVHDHGRYDVLGDPTEGALLYLGKAVGREAEEFRKQWKLIEEQPFDSVTKRMTVVVEQPGDGAFTFTKGAPESVLDVSSSVIKGTETEPLTAQERKKITDQMVAWAAQGLRVLAFSFSKGHEQTGATFIGMVAIHDEPRPEVNAAVARAKQAGIKVVMITGDNERTAEAVGVVAGIVEEGTEILTGSQIEHYSDEELLAKLPRVRIFARTSPFHKDRIVKLYQKLGEIVAVTGDGVNDAIALKQADVGVAMGLVGTDVARETADMVITDDNFASIVNAVEEGRNIIKNLKNAIKYLLSCNIVEALALIGGLLLGYNHIFFPLQLLYINLVTDGIPALALAFSPRDPYLMHKKPATETELLNGKDRLYILALGLVGTLLILFSFFYIHVRQADGVADAAAFSILTLMQSFVLIDLWLSHQSLLKHLAQLVKPIFLFAFLFPFVTQYMIVTSPHLAQVFRIARVGLSEYLVFVGLAGASFIGIKFVKNLIRI